MQVVFPQNQQFRKTSCYHAAFMIGRPPKKTAPPFGQRLSALRKERGYSQKELADLLQISRNNLAYYERSAKNPTTDFVTRCAEALDVKVTDLIEAETTRRKKTGPKPILEKQFEILRMMPKRDQEFVSKMIEHYLAGKGH